MAGSEHLVAAICLFQALYRDLGMYGFVFSLRRFATCRIIGIALFVECGVRSLSSQGACSSWTMSSGEMSGRAQPGEVSSGGTRQMHCVSWRCICTAAHLSLSGKTWWTFPSAGSACQLVISEPVGLEGFCWDYR